MPHIHTLPGQYDFTSSAYVFRTDKTQPMVLLHMHRILAKYLQFGGHVELHEHPWATVAHELREESGYDITQLQLLQPPHALWEHTTERSFSHPTPFTFGSHRFADLEHFHTDVGFAFITTQEPRHQIAKGESSQQQLFTQKEVADLPKGTIPENVRDSIMYAFEQVLPGWQATDVTKYRV